VFTIAPDACHTIADVAVDGASVGAVSSYTFANVTAAHTIAATFTAGSRTITASAGAGGTIVPAGDITIGCGGTATFALTADACNSVADVLVDGVSVGAVGGYTFTNVTASHTITIHSAGLFLKACSSLVGAGEGIAVRKLDRRTDHEIELAVVIGKTASNVSRTDALSHVAGYGIGLDITIRGSEDRSFRKSPDSYSVLGPWLVTADEIPDPGGLDLHIVVNGEQRQNSNTRYLILGVPELIELASSFYTLYPGDVIYTGTPEGVSPIEPGDQIVATIESIGTMRVSVRAAEGAQTALAAGMAASGTA